MKGGIVYRLLIVIALSALFCSCRTVKEIPIQTIEKVVIKDSIVHIRDTILYEVEKIVEKQVIPQLDTSRLNTPLAFSEAYLDTLNMKLNHTLEQKGSLEIPLDTVVTMQYVDRVVAIDVVVEVPVVKYRRDALFWVSIALNLLIICIILLKLYFIKR